MGLKKGDLITPSEVIALKARVKAEMLRRNQKGSLTEYGSSKYDFSFTPSTGTLISADQFEKIIKPLNAITDQGFSYDKGSLAKALAILNSRLATYESEPLSLQSGGSCAANCSGLCVGCQGCTSCTGCSSCTGTCQGTCSGCGGRCSGGCSCGCGSCDGRCGGCSGSCQGKYT